MIEVGKWLLSLLGDPPVSVVLTIKIEEIPRVLPSVPFLPSFLSCVSQIVEGGTDGRGWGSGCSQWRNNRPPPWCRT